MSQVSGSVNRADLPVTPIGPVPRTGQMLAGALAAGAAAIVLISWNLQALAGRYDTLAYLLQDMHAVEMARLRSSLLIAALILGVVGVVALISWRARSLTICPACVTQQPLVISSSKSSFSWPSLVRCWSRLVTLRA